MATNRRDLRKKFEEILKSWNTGDEEVLAEELADAALEAFRTPKIDLRASDPAWALLSGEGITQEQLDQAKQAEEAKGAFERDLHFNPLPWSSTKDWEKLEKFVIQEFTKDSLIFFKYDSWRKNKGKYAGALNNKNITQSPANFITCFPDFLAHTAMYPEETKPTQQSFLKTDENDTPMSY